MAVTLDFWALQYGSNEFDYPRDVDFYLTEDAYWDLILYGEIWDSYCNPEAISFNHIYTTNDGQPLTLKNWEAPRWIPNGNGVIPERFIAKTWKVVIYNDANRNSILTNITGSFSINDPYLIDKQGWFVSKILDITPYKNISVNGSVEIFCKVLQPKISSLKITVQKNQQSTITNHHF